MENIKKQLNEFGLVGVCEVFNDVVNIAIESGAEKTKEVLNFTKECSKLFPEYPIFDVTMNNDNTLIILKKQTPKFIKNKLRVSHYPQIPCKPFQVEVQNEREAYLIRETLANQHLFLFNNNFIPDYCNVIVVEMLEEEDCWIDYYNEEEKLNFNEFVEKYF